MIPRLLESQIRDRLFAGKTILLLGSRQVGKTTVAQEIVKNLPEIATLWLTGDDSEAVQTLSNVPLMRLRSMIGRD